MWVNAVCCSSVACSTDAAITFASARDSRTATSRSHSPIGHRQCNTKSIFGSRDYGRNSLTLPSGYCPEWWWFVPTSCTRQISAPFASSVMPSLNDALIVRRLRLNNLSVSATTRLVVAILPFALKLHRFSRSDRIVHLAHTRNGRHFNDNFRRRFCGFATPSAGVFASVQLALFCCNLSTSSRFVNST